VDHLASLPDARLALGGFVLDRARGQLLDAAGQPVPLRPKAWAMLLHLAQHAGEVVEREALLDAVWPDVTVTDDSVTQCVAELRRALGEAGPRLLRTVPRRGYVLDVAPAAPVPMVETVVVEPPALQPVAERVAPVRRRWWLPAGVVAMAVALLLSWSAPWRAASPPPAPVATAPAAPPAEIAAPLYREGLAAMEVERPRGGHWLAARALFLRAIEAAPDWAPPYSVAIYSYTNMINAGFSANAEADQRAAELLLERLFVLRPGAWQTFNAEAAVRRVQRRHADALAAYEKVVFLNPSVLPARANAGLMLVLLGRPAEAVDRLRATIAMASGEHPFLAYWQAVLGVALLHAGAEDFGAEAFREATADFTLLPGALRELHLAAALALAGETDAAAKLLADARRREPALTLAVLRAGALSADPAYVEQREALFRGLALAGME
jgi:DNA-binding winged helix-turn-helix (wHTH) protein/tetratricopeptide (TPR) repeat protein